MIEITFNFRPMPNLDAPLCVGRIALADEFVAIEAIKGHTLFVDGAAAHVISNALREGRNELRKIEVSR